MNSRITLLGAALSLASFAAYADDPYWEERDGAPIAEEGQKPEADYWETRDTNPDAISADEYKEAGVKPGEKPAEPAESTGAATATAEPQAAAQPAPAPAPATERPRLIPMGPVRRAMREANTQPTLMSGFGISAEAGGGFGGFVNNSASELTNLAGQWTARMVFGTRRHFAGEAAYVGSAQGLQTSFVSEGATLVGNGLEGAFRFNVFTGDWQPYAIAGLGYMRYTVQGATVANADISSGNVATFPIGAGLAWRKSGLVLDGRVSFHPATISDVVGDSRLSTWDVNAKAGFEF